MARPRIGIITNLMVVNERHRTYATGVTNCDPVAEVSDSIPLMIPADPRFTSMEELLETCDGFVLTGGRPNVHPEEYGEAETAAHGTFDRGRDALVLSLIRACVQRGQPIFGICRGFQEVAVAMGSTLHPEIRDLPGRMNHRMPPEGTQDEVFALRHKVTVSEGGPFHKVFGATEVMTNTLHGQAVLHPGGRFVIDGTAPDGTPEAAYVKDAPGFTLSVQWHPEFNAACDPVSRPLFEAFGEAARCWMARREPVQLARTA